MVEERYAGLQQLGSATVAPVSPETAVLGGRMWWCGLRARSLPRSAR